MVGEGQASWLGLCLQGRAHHTDAVIHISMGTARLAAGAGDPAADSNRMVSSTKIVNGHQLHGAADCMAALLMWPEADHLQGHIILQGSCAFPPKKHPKQFPVPGRFHVDQRPPAC